MPKPWSRLKSRSAHSDALDFANSPQTEYVDPGENGLDGPVWSCRRDVIEVRIVIVVHENVQIGLLARSGCPLFQHGYSSVFQTCYAA